MSKQYSDVCFSVPFFLGGGGGGHAQKPKFGDFSIKKKNFIRHFARFNFSRLSLALISKYYPILHMVKR